MTKDHFSDDHELLLKIYMFGAWKACRKRSLTVSPSFSQANKD